ncbi:hypothetical protein [uncultured Tessaracoccus sp.]|uniref:hypothetical protein n=1 Tax=uncultured Tessaracoccus sp. TaxID=905023 RepID=UPI00260B91DA|nr:hypothetical protein [uncultured Tessaracoccus sp.]
MQHRRNCLIATAVIATATVMLPAAADIDVPEDGVGEAVGMAWDADGETLWLAGDHANDGVLVGVSSDGERSEMSWKGEDLTSVQALAIHDGLMYVGDTGNSDRDRSTFTVYRFSSLQAGAKKYRSFVFEYPDDIDIQAMMVSGKGRIYFASTGDDPGIYRAPANPSRQGHNQLERVTDAPDGVTDGVFLPDGGTMVLRAADGVHVIDAFTWETKAVETYATQTHAESVAAIDDDTLLLGSTGVIREAAVPTSNITTTPSAEPSPSETLSPSESASAVPSSEPSPSSSATQEQEQALEEAKPRSTITMVALILAGVVGVAAGLVTFFARS